MTEFLLTRPTEDVIDRLVNDPTVSAVEVREVLNDIVGLTFEEALVFVDILHERRGWSLDTFLAIMEGIASVRYVTS
jgi:hypothetical protein